MPPRGTARRTNRKLVDIDQAKEEVLNGIANGLTIEQAAQTVGRTYAAINNWYLRDPEFRAQVAALRESGPILRQQGAELPPFPVFADRYLHNPLFPHQMNAYDVINGRPPRYWHPSMQYEPGRQGRQLINFPPNHAKTTTWVMDYATYKIHENPGICILFVSKTRDYAMKLLGGVKDRLTERSYRDMHQAFAPDGGWRDPDASWNATRIYVQGKYSTGKTEKEPTVEAVGMGGHIYGGRFDLIICDDVIDNENAHDWEDQADWLMTILNSRLPPGAGQMIIVGTRMASVELYSTLRGKTGEAGDPFFTYFAQPAVLDYGEGDSSGWLTLWPWELGSPSSRGATKVCISCYGEFDKDAGNGACDCGSSDVRWCQPRWTGPLLAEQRFPLGERRWSLIWQQQQTPENAVFNQRTVLTSINRVRTANIPLSEIHRPGGMHGLYVVGGLDPATVGYTAMVVAGLDRHARKRWLLDGVNVAEMRPADLRERVVFLTDRYKIQEWVIERNAFQKFLTDDPFLERELKSRGCKLTPHFTGKDKVDPDFGVMSLAPLFETTGKPPRDNPTSSTWVRVDDGDLIELPDDRQQSWVRTLVSQLISWEPSGMSRSIKTDLVMALWFTDIAFKRILDVNRGAPSHLSNPYLAGNRASDRRVINLMELKYEMLDRVA